MHLFAINVRCKKGFHFAGHDSRKADGNAWVLFDAERSIWGAEGEQLVYLREQWERLYGPIKAVGKAKGLLSPAKALEVMRSMQNQLCDGPLDGKQLAAGERDEGRADA